MVDACSRLLRTLAGAGLVSLIALLGCGPSGPKTYPVEGTVVYKGPGAVAQLAGGQVHFESVSEPKVTGSGEIESDGAFTIWSYLEQKDREGVPAGEYRVCVKLPRDDGGTTRRKNILHPRYQDFSTSGLQVTVSPGVNTPTIEVEAGR